MARRRRGQFPTPKKEKGLWKIRYYTDVAQDDGRVKRVKKTKCLGKVQEKGTAKKEWFCKEVRSTIYVHVRCPKIGANHCASPILHRD